MTPAHDAYCAKLSMFILVTIRFMFIIAVVLINANLLRNVARQIITVKGKYIEGVGVVDAADAGREIVIVGDV